MTRNVKAMMEKIITAETEDEIMAVCGEIDRLFDQEKIKWDEHELLYKLARKFLATF